MKDQGVPRRDLERVLGQAENAIALLARCRPVNAVAERERLLATFRRGAPTNPNWRYGFADGVATLRSALMSVAEQGEAAEGWDRLFADRARELAREAAIVEALGTPRAHVAAQARFPVDPGEHGRVAQQWAERWVREASEAPAAETVPTYEEPR